MIELVMYGMIPSAKTATRVSAPPEKRSMKERNPPFPPLFTACWRERVSTTGTGTWEPKR